MANWARRSKARSCYLFFFMLILVPLLRPAFGVGWFGWQFGVLSWVRALEFEDFTGKNDNRRKWRFYGYFDGAMR